MSRSLNVVNDVKTLEVEMLIREQGRSIKLLRTERREDARRRRQILIGAFCVDEDVPAELLELLDRNERRELSVWLAAWRYSQAVTRARVVFASAPARLDELVTALDTAAGSLAPDEADVLWHKLQAIAGLSGILCLRHNMLPRRIYASQTESPAGGSAGDSGRAA